MKLVLTSDYFWPHVGGGVERVTFEVARRLARRGHHVEVLTLGSPEDPAQARVEGVHVRRFPRLDLSRVTGLSVSIPRSRGLAAAVGGADVVNVHNLYFGTSALAGLRSRQPVVATLHVESFDRAGGALRGATHLYERTIGRRLLERSRFVTAVSDAVARRALRLGAREVQVIPNGIDARSFVPNGGLRTNRILFVGRLTRNKGPHVLLQALPEIQRAHPGTGLDIVGEGPLAARLQSRASRLSGVRFVGRVESLVGHLQHAAL
ncbi:MAG: glycosyltransferase family 4 protein, partial [Thermoplasmatota archaeon]